MKKAHPCAWRMGFGVLLKPFSARDTSDPSVDGTRKSGAAGGAKEDQIVGTHEWLYTFRVDHPRNCGNRFSAIAAIGSN